MSIKSTDLSNSMDIISPPRWYVRMVYAGGIWALIFAVIHCYWAFGGTIGIPPGSYGDSIVELFQTSFFRWYALAAFLVNIAGTFVAFAIALGRTYVVPRWLLLTITWAMCGILGIGFSANLIVIDILRMIGLVPLPIDGSGFLIRGFSLTGGILWLGITLIFQRRSRGACLFCGRSEAMKSFRWLRITKVVGYVSCLPALIYGAIKLYWSFGGTYGYIDATSARTLGKVGQFDFTVLLTMFAMLVALALIQPWGKKIPRWLLLIVAIGAAGPLFIGGIVGLTTVISQVAEAGSLSETALGGLTLPVFVLVYFCFSVWGFMLGLTALFYSIRTRRRCKHCGQG